MMKSKKTAAWLAAAAIGLTALQPAVWAEETISGDWIDILNKTPNEVLSGETTGTWGEFRSQKTYENAIVEFDWTCTESGQQAHIVFRESADRKNANASYFSANEAQMHRYIKKDGVNIDMTPNNPWVTNDALFRNKADDFPTFINQNTYKIRLQMKEDTMSAWVQDLSVDEPVWKYAGDYFSDGLFNTEPGYIAISIPAAGTVIDHFSIYSLDETAELVKTGAKTASMTLSAAPAEELNLYNVSLADYENNSLALEKIEKISDTAYNLEFETPFQSGISYQLKLDVKTSLGLPYRSEKLFTLDPTIDASFSDDSWRGQVVVIDNGNAVENPVIQNGAAMLGWAMSIKTTREIAANSIVEFDAKSLADRLTIGVCTGIGEDNTFNWFRAIMGENQIRRIIRKAGTNVVGDGFFSGNYPKTFEANKQYRFRYVTNGNSVTCYVKSEDDEDYTFAGNYTSDNLVQTPGRVGLEGSYTSGYNLAWNNITIYETDSKAELTADEEAIYITYSIEPKEDLSGVIECNGIKGERRGNTTYQFVIPGGVKAYESYVVTVPEGTKNYAGGNVPGGTLNALSYTLTAGADGAKAQFAGTDRGEDAAVICAVYQENGALSAVESKNLSQKDDENARQFFAGEDLTQKNCRLFVWDSYAGMRALAQ